MCFCFRMVRIGVLVVAACAASGLAAPAPTMTTVVRADPVSGKLVRTVVVSSRPVRSRAASVPSVASTDMETLQQLVEQSALRHDVDPLLVDSVIHFESGYNPSAVSNKGAQGLMQLIPATSHRFGVKNPFNPKDNIEGGVRYLKYLQDLFKDDRLALAAYNAGEAAVARHGWIPPYSETRNYVYQVGKRYGEARRAAPPKPAGAAAASVQPVEERHRPIEHFIDSEGRLHIRTR